jgi:DNA primase
MASIDEAIEIIRETPISHIVSFYHSLSRKGQNFEAICPFHSDTKPSLKINDDKKIYKCFACGAGGDAIRFVMDHQSLEFVDAVKNIAAKLSIQIDEKKKPKDPKVEMALRVLKAANRIYYKVGHELQNPAFTEFLNKRKITPEIAKEFELGFAPGNNALLNYLESLPDENDKKLALESARFIGIIRDSKGGRGHYDFFRDRITFPVWDHSGSIRGFSSRAVLPDQVPKYLNSGESPVFDKRNILYGFNIAKTNIRKTSKVIICEGHMDVVSLHQYGFNYSVGTQGVALSENCAKLLGNSANEIYLGMDSDDAGFQASIRINEIFLRLGVIAKFISYAPEKDPDDFLKAHGRLELEDRIENAPNFIDYMIDKIINESQTDTTDQKLVALNEVFQLLSPLKEDLRAKEKILESAKALKLNSTNEDIIKAYQDVLKKNKASFSTQSTNVTNSPNTELVAEVITPKVQNELNQTLMHDAPISKSELIILEQFLAHPELIIHKQITEILDLIDHFEVKRLIQWLKKIYLEIDESDYVIMLQNKVSKINKNDLKQSILKGLSNYQKLKLKDEVVEKTLNDFKKKLKLDKLKREKEFLKIKQKESSSEDESVEYLNQILEIEKKLREIKFK